MSEALQQVQKLKERMQRSIIGQEDVVDRLIIGLLANGNLLVEGLPGLAKTRAIKAMAKNMEADFSRIQFTPDLMPTDILGTTMLVEGEGGQRAFTFEKGPIFANIVLADEINRATPKTQSAMLEAMQEKSVTIGKETFALEQPFFVLATQNPLEMEGTYPLPEAQVDRFMLKVVLDYPKRDEESLIIRNNVSSRPFPKPTKVVSPETILKARKTVRDVYMDEKIERYLLDIVFATRQPAENGLADLRPLINYGGSPRASINLALASKAQAFMERRGYVIPEDVRSVCHDVMRHRIGLTYEAEAENISQEDLIDRILNTVEVP